MLLYDTLVRHAAKHCRTDRDHLRFQRLMEAQVFELTNVLPLLPDWERGRTQPIAKRPPYPNIWAEWETTESGNTADEGEIQWECGVHLMAATQSEIRNLFDQAPTFTQDTKDDLCEACDEWLIAMRYSRVRHATAKSFRDMIGQITVGLGWTVFGFRAEATVVRSVQMYPGSAFHTHLSEQVRLQTLHQDYGAFGLTLELSIYQQAYDPLMLPWPPLMAFALLHCRNVETVVQTPAPQLNRQVQRRGHPALASYHVLQLHVQESLQRLVGETATPQSCDRRTPRFHLVRGHFKHLQHERYHEKGWHWWPAHWRGDIESGAVMKDYAVVR